MFRQLAAVACAMGLGLPIAAPSAVAVTDARCQDEIVVGTSRLGTSIVACQLRGSDPAVKRRLLVVGSMHGNETAGIDVVSQLMERDLTGLGANVWVIATVNPDGVAAGTRGNARGVDLNGNFPTKGWKQRSRGTVLWGGPKASSEPETRALMKAVSTLRPRQAVVLHQAANVIDCPPYRSKSLSKRLHQLTGYPYRCLPVSSGNFTAWANQTYPVTSALTFELEAVPPAGNLDRVAEALITIAPRASAAPAEGVTPGPTAAADTGSVVRGQTISLDVLANDRGAAGDLVAPVLAVVTVPATGKAEVQDADGPGPARPQVTYTPALDSPATESFTYRVTEGTQSAEASVTVSIANAAPTAADDTAQVRSGANSVVEIPVLGNDTDVDGGTVVVDSVGAPGHGTAVAGQGTVTYDPTDGYVGPDSFTYRISDGQGATAQARVTVTVLAASTALKAVPDEVATARGTRVRVDVIANDSGGRSPLRVISVGKPKGGGTATLGKDRRTITYTPARRFVGTARITYKVRDKRGATASGRLVVTVTDPRATPTATPSPARTATATIPAQMLLGHEYSIAIVTGGFTGDGMAAEVQRLNGSQWQAIASGTVAPAGGAVTLSVTPALAPLTASNRTLTLDLRVRVQGADGAVAESAATRVKVAPDIAAEVSGPLQRADVPFSYRPGCPVGPESLRRLSVNYWDYSGAQARGSLIAHADAVPALTSVFTQAFNAGFRVKRMTPVDAYYDSGRRSPTESDHASMAAGNTSAFNCRPVVGNPTKLSAHSYGVAIDINPFENPYVVGTGAFPAGSAAFLKRSPCRTGMICDGGVLPRAMQAAGWPWGARWSKPDYHHFSATGR